MQFYPMSKVQFKLKTLLGSWHMNLEKGHKLPRKLNKYAKLVLNGPQRKLFLYKLSLVFENNKGADQPARIHAV